MNIYLHHNVVPLKFTQRWDTADAEIKIPLAVNPELSMVPSFTPRLSLNNSLSCFACCREFCLAHSLDFFVAFITQHLFLSLLFKHI